MIEGYIDSFSIFPDSKIKLFVKSSHNNINIQIIDFYKLKSYYNNKHFISKQNDIDSLSFAEGYKWEQNVTITKKLKPDLYFIKLNEENDSYYIPLIVKNPKKENDIVVLMNTNTWNAYNSNGGAGFYSYSSPNKKYALNRNKSSIITYDRPFNRLNGEIKNYLNKKDMKSHLIFPEISFLIFLKRNNYNFDLISDYDLHLNYPINNYKIFISSTHPEYWSNNMFKNLENYNGHMLTFGGNVGFRLIEINNKQIKFIRDIKKEDNILNNISGSLYDPTSYNKEVGYKIKKNHKIFKGICKKNDVVANDNCGWEMDVSVRNNSSEILAKGDIKHGCDMLLFRHNDKIRFSVGSITFTKNIDKNGINSKIAKNVIDLCFEDDKEDFNNYNITYNQNYNLYIILLILVSICIILYKRIRIFK